MTRDQAGRSQKHKGSLQAAQFQLGTARMELAHWEWRKNNKEKKKNYNRDEQYIGKKKNDQGESENPAGTRRVQF